MNLISEETQYLVDFLGSKEFTTSDKGMRKVLLKAFDSMTPEQKKAAVYGDEATEGLTLALKQNAREFANTLKSAAPSVAAAGVRRIAKEGAPALIDMAGQGIGGAIGGRLGGFPGMVAGESLGAVGADRANRALGLRDPDSTMLPFVGDVGNQKLLGPVTTGDIVAGGAPLAFRAVAGGLKALTHPARKAYRQFDDDVAALTQRKEEGLIQSQAKGNQALAEARDKAIEINTAAKQKYTSDVAADAQRVQDQTDNLVAQTELKNQERLTSYAEKAQLRQERMGQHIDAQKNVPAEGLQGLTIRNYNKAYDESEALAKGALPVDLGSLKGSIGSAFAPHSAQPNILKGKATHVAEALEAWPRGPEGELLDTAPLGTLIQLQKNLGGAIGRARRTGGEDLGLAKKLWKEVETVLQGQVARDPEAAKALEKLAEAKRNWKINEFSEEFLDLFKIGKHGNTAYGPDGIKLNSDKIRTDFTKMLNESPFVDSLTPEQIATAKEALRKLPKAIPADPGNPPTPLTVDASRLPRPRNIPQPPTVQPDYSDAASPALYGQGKWVLPEPDAPDAGKFPFGTFILARIFGGNIGSAVAGQQGSNQLAGWVAGVLSIAPHLASSALMRGPKGQALVRHIMTSPRTTPQKLAALEAAARSFAESSDVDDEQR